MGSHTLCGFTSAEDCCAGEQLWTRRNGSRRTYMPLRSQLTFEAYSPLPPAIRSYNTPAAAWRQRMASRNHLARIIKAWTMGTPKDHLSAAYSSAVATGMSKHNTTPYSERSPIVSGARREALSLWVRDSSTGSCCEQQPCNIAHAGMESATWTFFLTPPLCAISGMAMMLLSSRYRERPAKRPSG